MPCFCAEEDLKNEYSRHTFEKLISDLQAHFESLLAENQFLSRNLSVRTTGVGYSLHGTSSSEVQLAATSDLHTSTSLHAESSTCLQLFDMEKNQVQSKAILDSLVAIESKESLAGSEDLVPLEPQASSIGLINSAIGVNLYDGELMTHVASSKNSLSALRTIAEDAPQVKSTSSVTFDNMGGTNSIDECKRINRRMNRQVTSDGLLPPHLRDYGDDDISTRLSMEPKDSCKDSENGMGRVPTQRASAASIHARMTLASKLSKESVLPAWYDPQEEVIINAKNIPSQNLLMRSDDSIVHSKKVFGRCVISPVGRFRILWDLCAIFFFIVDIWMLPLVIVFLTNEGVPQAFTGIEIAVTVFFSFDIVLNFITGFPFRDKLIMDPYQIAKRYLKNWFWADFIATMPWYLILGGMGNFFSTVRAAKFTKAFKLLKLVRLLRARQFIKQFHHGGAHLRFFWFGASLVNPLKILAAPLLVAHINGSIYPLTQPSWEPSDDFDRGMWMYYRGLWWGYLALTGDPISSDPFGPTSLWFGVLTMLVTSERICLLAILLYWVGFHMLSTSQEDARQTEVKNSATMYLRKRKIATKTQMQVLNHVAETGQARKLQQHFKLMVDDLPMVLHQKICEELWAKHLMSLGLILHVAHWHNEFIGQLAILTVEEILASKMILFRVGDAAKSAYFIIDGALTVVTEDFNDQINDFTDGTWLGEKALVNPLLRRSGTAVAKSFSTLMNVPGDGFHDLLKDLDLLRDFQLFVKDHMWRGLCGRCGVLGDHFTHNCPLIQTTLQMDRTRSAISMGKKKQRWFRFGSLLRAPMQFTNMTARSGIAGDLEKFLSAQHLRWVAPMLKELKVLDLERLKELDLEILRAHLEDHGGILSDEEAQALSPAAVKQFLNDVRSRSSTSLLNNVSREEHLVFLSHYKVESGTEAALMRHELEMLIGDDSGSPAHAFTCPIFLDSEDLQILGKLQNEVRNCHNFVLLLTEHVLTRPWVLIEIVTALEAGVRILPVLLLRGFDEFAFPDDRFYQDLHAGKILEPNVAEMLAQCNISLQRVEDALRVTFNRIAVPYSPHRQKMIRQSELRSLLQQCRIRRPYMPDSVVSRSSRYASRRTASNSSGSLGSYR